MAERIVSPGVFTQERDLSFLPEGIAQIGAAFIGPTTKGPAFIPTQVQGIDGFVTAFGEPDGTSYTGYAVKNYLQEAGSATIVRVLGTAGYSKSVVNVFATGSNGQKLLAVLHPTISGSSISGVQMNGTATSSFGLFITSNTNPATTSSGLNASETSPSYIAKYFGTDARTESSNNAYVYASFPDAITQAGNNVTITASIATLDLTNNPNAAVQDSEYSHASTPWIQSQIIGAGTIDLFKFHTLGDGNFANSDIKISITGITAPDTASNAYGTFTVLVRDINDMDTATNVLESYDNVTLDPDSPNFIARVIGNSVPTYDSSTGEVYYVGDFRNVSKYVRVEMTEGVVPTSAVPCGFAGLFSVANVTQAQATSAPLVTSRWLNAGVAGYTTASVDKRYYYGYDFNSTTALSLLAPIATTSVTASVKFTIENLFEVPTTSAPFSRSIAITGADARGDVGYRRFTVPFQGGFDGLNPAREIAMGGSITSTNSQGFDLSTATSDGSKAYKRGLTAISNPDNIDFNLLVIPGVIQRLHSYIAQEAIDLCEIRGDAFYLVDLGALNDSVNQVTNAAETLDTNYAAAYYPWVRVLDTNTNKLMWAPPSTVLPEVYAYNDNVGAEWFAPAGLNRGGIPGAVGVKTRLSQALRDELYESKVNPIAQFPSQGICVWGQKTLQTRSSALDRVNVRRLLITVKKFIASSARYLVFEQNTEATRNRFLNIVNPYLAGIQQRSGLTAFRVVMDETNNTPDIIDRNILAGAIYLQPTRTAEFIKLDFNILPTGAVFDTI